MLIKFNMYAHVLVMLDCSFKLGEVLVTNLAK